MIKINLMFKIAAKILLATLLSLFALSASAQIPMSSKYDFQNNVEISGDTFTLYTNSTVPSDSAFVIIDSANNRVRFLDFSAVGGSSFVDSTRLARDSVLIFWQNGVKVDSATIRVASSGGSFAPLADTSLWKYSGSTITTKHPFFPVVINPSSNIQDFLIYSETNDTLFYSGSGSGADKNVFEQKIFWRNATNSSNKTKMLAYDNATNEVLIQDYSPPTPDLDWQINGNEIYSIPQYVTINGLDKTNSFGVYTSGETTDTANFVQPETISEFTFYTENLSPVGFSNGYDQKGWAVEDTSNNSCCGSTSQPKLYQVDSFPAFTSVISENPVSIWGYSLGGYTDPIAAFAIQATNDTSQGWTTIDTVSGLTGADYNIVNETYRKFIAPTAYYTNWRIKITAGDGSTTYIMGLRLFGTQSNPLLTADQSDNNVRTYEKTIIDKSIRAGILFDTLSNTGNDTSITLNLTNKQGTHLYLGDTLVTGVLINIDTSTLDVGYIQDFSLTIEVDTSVTAPTLFFTSGKFQFSGGEAPTLSTGNTDATRKDILTFRYDGTAEKRLKVIPVNDFQNN